MIKYNVTRYEEFFSCMATPKPVYIEKFVGHLPIPELQGFVYPFVKDNKILIATAMVDDNKHLPLEQFKHMIINCNLSGDVIVKLFDLSSALAIYEQLKSMNFNLFVLDDTYDKNIENNN